MNSRESLLNRMRPSIDIKFLKIKNSSFEESFQNLILRPIIKVQTSILVQAFKKYADTHKGVFYQLRPEKKTTYIENAIKKCPKMSNPSKNPQSKRKQKAIGPKWESPLIPSGALTSSNLFVFLDV